MSSSMNMKHVYFTAFKSILIKEVTRFTRIWVQTLVPPAISMTLDRKSVV